MDDFNYYDDCEHCQGSGLMDYDGKMITCDACLMRRINELTAALKTVYNNAPKTNPDNEPAKWGPIAWSFWIAGGVAAKVLGIKE